MYQTARRFLTWLACCSLGLAVACSVGAARGQAPTITERDAIAGSLDINFKTRADAGARDEYSLKLGVLKTLQYSGKITRDAERGNLGFDVTLAVSNPRNLEQQRMIGKWVGTAPRDATRRTYDFGGGNPAAVPVRFAIEAVGAQPAMVTHFSGRLVDRLRKQEGLAEKNYHRLFGGKLEAFKVGQVDSLSFEDLQLAKGPIPSHQQCVVNGHLGYVPATRNWHSDGVTFKYTDQGREVEDVVTGSLKWNPDPERGINGKSHYELNLRFNEAKHAPAAVPGLSLEDAYFKVDDSIPCLIGKISYEDHLLAGTDTPHRSKITYELTANKLTKTQIANFAKLWLLCLVPMHEE